MSETKVIDIKELKFDEHNFNRHNDEGMSLLEKSIKENGLGRSILLDKDNNIVGGNGVTEKAIELGKTKVRIIETDGTELIAVKRTDLTLDSEQGRKMALADNSVAHANLEWNEEELQKAQDDWGLVPEEWGVEMPDMGLPDELAGDSKTTEYTDVKDDDFDPDAKFEAKVKAGEIWQLGNHRLMCGDSTDAEDVAKLMNGEKADMCFTDPPYGYEYKSNWQRKGGKNFDMIMNDDKILDFFPVVIPHCSGWVFVCTTWKVLDIWMPLFKKYLKLTNMVVWDKGCSGMGDLKKTFYTEHEIILTANQGKEFYGNRIGSVWNFQTDVPSSYLHPTQKPVKLSACAIEKTTREGEIVLDVFGGSGSTMIACEQLGRKCRMMELDPHYCDVIIARWEKLTGNKAEKMEN